MTELHGFCDERFAQLGDLFRHNLDAGVDNGACLAATLDGELVVDLWGGHADWGLEKPWAEDTIGLVFSTSKIVAIITLLLVYDRGLLDLDAPIAQYWPEFGQRGKDTITTRQVLVHRSGVPGFGRSIAFEEFHDWDRMVSHVEKAELWYEPDTVTHYSFFASGYILGELVGRITGTPFAVFFRRELAEPLDADFHFGLVDPADQARIAAIWPPEQLDDYGVDPVFAEMEQGNWLSPEANAAVMPTVNGIGNARGIARITSVIANGGTVNGRRYLSPETVAEAGSEQSYAEDRFLGWCRWGLGWAIDHDDFPAPTPSAMHWGGYGGSFATMDPAAGISVAFVPNTLRVGAPGDVFGDDRLLGYWRAVGDVAKSLV